MCETAVRVAVRHNHQGSKGERQHKKMQDRQFGSFPSLALFLAHGGGRKHDSIIVCRPLCALISGAKEYLRAGHCFREEITECWGIGVRWLVIEARGLSEHPGHRIEGIEFGCLAGRERSVTLKRKKIYPRNREKSSNHRHRFWEVSRVVGRDKRG